METATSTASAIKTQFELHTRLFNNVLEGIENTESDSRLNDKVNHIKWLAGHLLATRFSMHQIGGFEPDAEMQEKFGHGKAISDEMDYPSIETIVSKWNDISEKIINGLANLPEQMLDNDAPAKVPVSDPSMRGFLAFLSHHEAYHLGQIGILRKYIGKEAMKYA